MSKTPQWAMSNLAWDHANDTQVASILKEYGFQGIEVAPSKVWADPFAVTEQQAQQYKDWWRQRDFKLVGMQSLLFGKADLKLFGTQAEREALREALRTMIRLGGWLEIPVLVFGSPKNRLRQELPMTKAFELAAEFFKPLGEYAAQHKTALVFEPNAKAYGCDFITTSKEAFELVQAVNSPGFQLHLDSGNMLLEEEPLEERFDELLPQAAHFHLSRPQMSALTSEWLGEQTWLNSLKKLPWVSIEMLTTPTESLQQVAHAARAASHI